MNFRSTLNGTRIFHFKMSKLNGTKKFLPANEDIDDYIQNIDKEGVWGGYFELLALCFALNVELCLHLLNKPPILIRFEEMAHEELPTLHLAFLEEGHYASVRRKGDNPNSPSTDITLDFSVLRCEEGFNTLHDQAKTILPPQMIDESPPTHLTRKGLPDKRYKVNKVRKTSEIKERLTLVADGEKKFSLLSLPPISSPLNALKGKCAKLHPRTWSKEDVDLAIGKPIVLKAQKLSGGGDGDILPNGEKTSINLQSSVLPRFPDLVSPCYSCSCKDNITGIDMKIQTLQDQFSTFLLKQGECQPRFIQEFDDLAQLVASLRSDLSKVPEALGIIKKENISLYNQLEDHLRSLSQENSRLSSCLSSQERFMKSELDKIQKLTGNSSSQGSLVDDPKLVSEIRTHLQNEISALSQELSCHFNHSEQTLKCSIEEFLSPKISNYENSEQILSGQVQELSSHLIKISEVVDELKVNLYSQVGTFNDNLNKLSSDFEKIKIGTLPSSDNYISTKLHSLEQDYNRKLEEVSSLIQSLQSENSLLHNRISQQPTDFNQALEDQVSFIRRDLDNIYQEFDNRLNFLFDQNTFVTQRLERANQNKFLGTDKSSLRKDPHTLEPSSSFDHGMNQPYSDSMMEEELNFDCPRQA